MEHGSSILVGKSSNIFRSFPAGSGDFPASFRGLDSSTWDIMHISKKNYFGMLLSFFSDESIK
jgi:hypothetical protein